MMIAPSAYLAGPISGLSYDGATNWRDAVKSELRHAGIVAYSPMRAKEYLANVEYLAKDCDGYSVLSVLSSNRGIMTRDYMDAATRDLLFVNLLGASAVSIGTVMEIAWGFMARKPIVCAIEKSGNPHDHGMVKEAIGFRVESIGEALHLTKAILLP